MPIPQSQVLPVRDLCDHLGYTDTESPKRQYDLTCSTSKFREGYVSNDGIPGKDMIDWASETGNRNIKTMAQDFLEREYGMKHWPPRNGGLEYPKDKER